jgi:hypothetical protein
MFLGRTAVSSVSNGLYFQTLKLVSDMRVIYTSKGMSKKFGVRVIYWKILSPYLLQFFCNVKCSMFEHTNHLSRMYCNCECLNFESYKSYSFSMLDNPPPPLPTFSLKSSNTVILWVSSLLQASHHIMPVLSVISLLLFYDISPSRLSIWKTVGMILLFSATKALLTWICLTQGYYI